MAGIFGLLMSGAGVLKDQYFNLTSLLLPGNGTNGAQNNTFLDSGTANSGSGFTITRNGDTTQGTFSPFSQTGWGAYFDGSNDFLTAPDDAAWTIDADYTIEFWAYATSFPGTFNQVITHTVPGSNLWWAIYWNTSSGWAFEYNNGSSATITSRNQNTPLNNWVHFAVVKSGTTGYIFLNGQQAGATFTFPTVVDNSAPLRIGTWSGSSDFWNGYISNMRIVKGRAVYTSNFTPPILPLGKTSGGTNPPQGTETKLLTLQSNRFVDNSDSALVLTPTNGVAITPFSPFAPTSSYSAAAVGGSGYFDGSADYLTVPTNAAFNLGTADFTIEWSFYYSETPPAGSGYDYLFGMGANATTGIALYIEGGVPKVWNGSAVLTSSQSVVGFAWYHLALVRSSGTLTMYLNGTSVNSVPFTSNLTGGELSSGPSIGTWSPVDLSYFPGYISNFRIVKGTAVYTGAFTPPTKPLATSGANSSGSYPSTTNINTSFASSATSLLLNFTNAGVVDATAKNDLLTVGTAQISTAQSKFGGGSIYINGSGNRAVAPNSPNAALLDFGTGDVTIEMWVYPTTTSILRALLAASNSGFTSAGYAFYITSSNFLELDVPTQSIISNNNAISANTWTHIAFTRASGTNRLFVNGNLCTTSTNSLTNAINSGGNELRIGGTAITGGEAPFTGYIDDIRITKGLARYTAAFTPSGPFPVQ
jgi:hypothetical protein